MNTELIKEINGKEYRFKFKSKKIVDLEKITGKSIIEQLKDMSMTNIARLLKYASLDEIDEYELLDNLLDTMTYEEIIDKIILETCVVSGIISKSDLDQVNMEIEKKKAEMNQ